jgi:hypothetical protein
MNVKQHTHLFEWVLEDFLYISIDNIKISSSVRNFFISCECFHEYKITHPSF